MRIKSPWFGCTQNDGPSLQLHLFVLAWYFWLRQKPVLRQLIYVTILQNLLQGCLMLSSYFFESFTRSWTSSTHKPSITMKKAAQVYTFCVFIYASFYFIVIPVIWHNRSIIHVVKKNRSSSVPCQLSPIDGRYFLYPGTSTFNCSSQFYFVYLYNAQHLNRSL